ncbi:MAG TPA: hypothetical protein VF691_16330 [Cytophagaceae bacterium]
MINKLRIILLALCEIFNACRRDPAIVPASVDNDYIPLVHGVHSRYMRKNIRLGSSEIWDIDTIHKRIEKDSLVRGKLYTQINYLGDGYDQIIRKEGSNYFRIFVRGSVTDTMETLMMKENVMKNELWQSYQGRGGGGISTFRVLDVKAQDTINNIVYNNVALIKEEWGTSTKEYTLHKYAAGIGEVYSYLPYPSSLRFNDAELMRIIK